MHRTRILTAVIVVLLAQTASNAAIHLFDLSGNAGTGLLPGNENHAINGTPGSGGEIGAGISYDDVTNNLTFNIGWGSGNGFTNLTGPASVGGHIHGPTANSAPAGFSQDAGVAIFLSTLAGYNASATNGGCTACTVTLDATQEAQLLAERLYINFHTSANQGGEIRGHLIRFIPEPSTLLLLSSTSGVAMILRRKRK